MSIKNVKVDTVGLSGVKPKWIYIETDDSLATVTASGYLNDIRNKFGIPLSESDMALVSIKETPTAKDTVALLELSNSGGDWSLVPSDSPGSVTLPTTANHLAVYSDAEGQLTEDASTAINVGNIQAGESGTAGYFASFPSTASKGQLRLTAADNAGDHNIILTNASHGQASTYTIPDGGQASANVIISEFGGTQNIASGNLQVDTGNVLAGSDANAGKIVSHPGTTASGTLELAAVDSSTDSAVTVSNADFGQASVISIPDPGAATANFLLDDGSANILAHQEFVGIESVLTFGTGTWTVTRIARGDYVSRHSAADETSIIAIDVTPMIRTASSKGFRLDSFDVIYSIATDALEGHSVTLDRVEYANNVAVSVNSIAITGSLATATQANPYLTNIAVDTPAFDNTADSKYVIELTVNNSATSEYDYYGIMLRFSETIA